MKVCSLRRKTSMRILQKLLLYPPLLVIIVFGGFRLAIAQSGQSSSNTSSTAITDVPPLFDATDGSRNYLRSIIPANPAIDPNSSAIIRAARFAKMPFRASGPEWLIPIYRTTNSDPTYNPPLHPPEELVCSVGESMHIPDAATRELPPAFPFGDAWIVTVNTDDDTVKAIWQADKSSGSWKGSCAGSFPLHGNGFRPLHGIGIGSGCQFGAGIILFSELAKSRIDHALYLTSTTSCKTFREPATRSDGHSTASTCLPMGARLQLDPAVNCDTLKEATAAERMICHTMQTYGGYILDSGGPGPINGISIQGDDLTDPNRSPWQIPGNSERGNRNCSPVSATCGQAAHVGITGTPDDLAHIPWSRLRLLAHWDGQ